MGARVCRPAREHARCEMWGSFEHDGKLCRGKWPGPDEPTVPPDGLEPRRAAGSMQSIRVPAGWPASNPSWHRAARAMPQTTKINTATGHKCTTHSEGSMAAAPPPAEPQTALKRLTSLPHAVAVTRICARKDGGVYGVHGVGRPRLF